MATSTRTLTGENFSDGSSIDGNRLERAMDDLERRVNNIPKGDLARRYTQTQYVMGFQPELTGGIVLPFMREFNDFVTDVHGTAPTAFANTKRTKGIAQSTSSPLVWTTAFGFHEPVIIVDVFVALLVDSHATKAYANTFAYGAAPTNPPGKVASDPVSDIDVVLTVDNPWRPEDRSLGAVEIGRHKFKATAEYINRINATLAAGGYNDMLPAFPAPGTYLRGVGVWARDLNLPIHRDARVRLALALPHWAADEAPWGVTPTNEQYFSLCATVLEEIQP